MRTLRVITITNIGEPSNGCDDFCEKQLSAVETLKVNADPGALPRAVIFRAVGAQARRTFKLPQTDELFYFFGFLTRDLDLGFLPEVAGNAPSSKNFLESFMKVCVMGDS
jgi:hypothetical protein